MNAAVDLHCHILPGLDDGARDIGDAIAMARQAEADGIAAVCATPHIRHDHRVAIDELPARRTELQHALDRAGCEVEILAGGELAATELPTRSDAELNAITLGGGGSWLLLEPAPGPLDERLDEAVADLNGRGFRALIAHPERHYATDLIPRLRRLTTGGALIQATAAFLTDAEAGPWMLELARAGVIHVLGSDAHSSRAGRPVTLSGALKMLAGADPAAAHLEWIARLAPTAIVVGAGVRPPY